MQSISNRPDVHETIDLVAKKIDFVKDCRGKNVVVFIGREQVGKSTTINALLGTKFQYDESNDRNVVQCPGERFHAPMGSSERQGLMCTVFPAVYHDTTNDLYYLDTQGFFGTDKDPNEVAAASVLLDAAIKSAASVKIVYVEDFEELYKGLTRVQDTVKLLDRVVLSENVPIFFLYNRYHPSSLKAPKFYNYNTTDEQKNSMAEEEIETNGFKLVKSTKENTRELLERNNRNSNSSSRFAHNASTNEIKRTVESNNNENEENSEITSEEANAAHDAYYKEKCGQIIDFNFKAKRFGYIDVLSDWSINKLKRNIMQLPTVDKSHLSFNCCDSSRTQFSREFEETLLTFIDSINNVYFSIRYPPSLIDELLNRNRDEKEHNERLLENLNNGIEIDISDSLNNFKSRKNQKLNDRQKLQNDLEIVKNKIKKIKHAPPVKYVDYPFDEPVGFFKFWRNHEVKYNENLPFVGVEENLAQGTFRDKIINFNISRFQEYWDSENQRTLLKIDDDDNPVYNFKVKYTSASKGRKASTALAYIGGAVASGILGFFGLVPLCLPLGAAIGLATKKRNCTGIVSFYVRYQDKESNVLQRLQKDSENLVKLLDENKTDLDKIDSELNQGQKQILTANIEQIRKNIEVLEDIRAFVQRILDIWNLRTNEQGSFHSMLEELTTYNEIALMLYPPPVNNESVYNYSRFFERLTTATQVTRNITAARVINEFRTRTIFVINDENESESEENISHENENNNSNENENVENISNENENNNSNENENENVENSSNESEDENANNN